MNRFLFAALILCLVSLTGCSFTGAKTFKTFAGRPGTEIIHLPKAMVKAAAAGTGAHSLEVATIKGPLTGDIMEETERIAAEKNLELLIEVTEPGEHVSRYGRATEGKNPRLKELLILTSEGSETALVFIEGNFDLRDLNNMNISGLDKVKKMK